jgi:hypothetical protein
VLSFKIVSNKLERLERLEILVLVDNQLDALPPNLHLMKKSLQLFDVSRNTLLGNIADRYEGEKLTELYPWLKEFESGSKKQNILKVLLLGEGNLHVVHPLYFDLVNLQEGQGKHRL